MNFDLKNNTESLDFGIWVCTPLVPFSNISFNYNKNLFLIVKVLHMLLYRVFFCVPYACSLPPNGLFELDFLILFIPHLIIRFTCGFLFV